MLEPSNGVQNGGRQATFDFYLVPKFCLFRWFFSFAGILIIYCFLCFDWVNVIFAACLILRGHDTHIDFLWLSFLVGMICPLMQEHFIWPLWKRKSLPLRLNKSFRLFNLPQSASWIWIANDDILNFVCELMWWFPPMFWPFCHAGPSSFSDFCRMLNFHR